MGKHMTIIYSKLPKVKRVIFVFICKSEFFFFILKKSKASETCCDSILKAARSNAWKFKKLDGTGIMMPSCRHGIVDKAVNMHHGKTFRHTHFMLHLDLPEKGCHFFCGDVMCRYWDWAKKVASSFPEFKPTVEEMKPFLGRMRAKVHVWYCQVNSQVIF